VLIYRGIYLHLNIQDSLLRMENLLNPKIPWTPGTLWESKVHSWGREIWRSKTLCHPYHMLQEEFSGDSSSLVVQAINCFGFLCWFLCPTSTWNKAKVLLVLYYIMQQKCTRYWGGAEAGATGLWVWDLMMHPSECTSFFPLSIESNHTKVLSLVPRTLKIQGISLKTPPCQGLVNLGCRINYDSTI
jgi:hypothetical protein